MDILIIISTVIVATIVRAAIIKYHRKKNLQKQVDEFTQALDKALETQSKPLTDIQFEQICLRAFEQTLNKTNINPPPFRKMFQVKTHGLAVFGTEEKYQAWLDIDNYALGCIKPRTLIYTSEGLEQLDQALGRIEHGIF